MKQHLTQMIDQMCIRPMLFAMRAHFQRTTKIEWKPCKSPSVYLIGCSTNPTCIPILTRTRFFYPFAPICCRVRIALPDLPMLEPFLNLAAKLATSTTMCCASCAKLFWKKNTLDLSITAPTVQRPACPLRGRAMQRSIVTIHPKADEVEIITTNHGPKIDGETPTKTTTTTSTERNSAFSIKNSLMCSYLNSFILCLLFISR